MGFEVEGTIPMGVCETRPGRPGFPLLSSSMFVYYSVLSISFLFCTVDIPPPCHPRKGFCYKIRRSGERMRGRWPLCCGERLPPVLVSLPLEATSTSTIQAQTHLCRLHLAAHVCARVHFYEAVPWIEQ